ncbi:hypothetical protein ABZV60_05765 [Streptomyces sp. NPDC004787]|uniref:hypothetical protein n=1 Tax=Streptomyces sp. NPDC004787 TaxID=3154291 RepID=UPI0033BF1BDB
MLNRIRRVLARTRERYSRTPGRHAVLPPTCLIRSDAIRGEETVLVRPYVPAIEYLLTPAAVF